MKEGFSLNSSDFTFTFESQGNAFLFEYLVSVYYMPGESLIFSKGEKIRSFFASRLLKKINQEGESRLPTGTHHVIASLDKLVEQAVAETLTYQKKDKIKREDAERVFSLAAAICKDYSYFDPYYWDSAYEKSKNNLVMRQNIELVESFKNKVRARMNDVFFSEKGYFGVFVEKLSKQFGVKVDDLNLYQEEEVLDLFDGKKVGAETLIARREAFVFYKDSNFRVHVIDGDAAKRFINDFEKDVSIGDSVSGKTAYGKGLVKGIVKVITRDYKDVSRMYQHIHEMAEGSVLVSETTDPEMIGAIKKASAIITDVGGMLSHAAITSRELKIPCVVETQYATKVLRDGDLVEVDANVGVVKILKRV